MYVAAGTVFEAVYESALTGLAGTIEVAIIDNQGNVVFGPTAAGISEEIIDLSPTGIYEVDLTAPVDVGQFTIVWSFDGTFDPKTVTVEDLLVVSVGSPLPPIGPPSVGPTSGPCSLWANVDQVASCCEVDPEVDPFILVASLTQAATAASQTLYELSGRLFSGSCERTVRPCGTQWCGFQVLSRGHIVGGWNGSWWGSERSCGCQPLSRVLLSGYPVREITEVKIDGSVVDPTTYRLDERRWLVRTNGQSWPSCQRLDLEDTEDGTFSVTYSYGQDPPFIGISAAAQLGCELYRACGGGSGTCALPTGVTRITRQGIVVERLAFSTWAFNKSATGTSAAGWHTGLPLVDAFLGAYARTGLIRRPSVWSASSSMRYARPVGP